MPNITLTDAAIRRFAVPDKGTITYWDSIQRGLGVRVSPKGVRTFIVLVGSGARQKLGRYPLLSLATARDEARKVLAKKTLGTYEKPSILSFTDAVTKYLAACERKNRPRTVAEYRRHLVYFPFGARKLDTVKKRDVAAELEKIEAAGERAHALVSIKVFFSWCAAQGHIDASPVSALKAAAQRQGAKPKHVLSDADIKEVLRRALAHPYPFGSIVALLILTGQRRNEIASLKWEHVTPETITIPGDVAKNHLEHTFPYGQLVKGVLEGVPAHAKQSEYVFPASREHVSGIPTTIFNGWGKAKKAFDATLKDVGPYKLHDLRRTFATLLQRLGIGIEVREKLLNHISGTQAGVAGIYGRYGFEAEMEQAIIKYEAFLLELLSRD